MYAKNYLGEIILYFRSVKETKRYFREQGYHHPCCPELVKEEYWFLVFPGKRTQNMNFPFLVLLTMKSLVRC